MVSSMLWLALLIIVAYWPVRALAGWCLDLWDEKVAADANARLQLKIPDFARMPHNLVVDEVVSSPDVLDKIQEQARRDHLPVSAVASEARGFALDIVPRFKAAFYFRVGYRLARALLLLHYRVKPGRIDGRRLDEIGEKATVVLVMNHLSTIDVLLVNYLASRHSTICHFAGEWSAVAPLYQLQKLAGNCIVQRETDSALYRAVLKSYVQLAVARGMHLGVFPEGELSRNGRLGVAKLGLMKYVATATEPNCGRDVVFIPVSVSYEQVLEDKNLVMGSRRRFMHRGKLYVILSVFGFLYWIAKMALTPRARRCGIAAASFGTPISLDDWKTRHEVDVDGSSATGERWLEALWTDIQQEIRRNVPILPMHLIAFVLLDSQPSAASVDDLISAACALAHELRRSDAVLVSDDESQSMRHALALLEQRKLIRKDQQGHFEVAPFGGRILQYYVSTIMHLLPPGERPSNVGNQNAELS